MFVATKWVAVSASISGLFIFGGENGGSRGAIVAGPSTVRTQIRFRTQNRPKNGAPCDGRSQLETTLCNSLWLSPSLPLQAPFLTRFFSFSRLCFFGSNSQHHSWYINFYWSINWIVKNILFYFAFIRRWTLDFFSLGVGYSYWFLAICTVGNGSSRRLLRCRRVFSVSGLWRLFPRECRQSKYTSLGQILYKVPVLYIFYDLTNIFIFLLLLNVLIVCSIVSKMLNHYIFF